MHSDRASSYMAQLQGLLSSAGRACALKAYGHGLEPHRRLYVAVLAASSRRPPRVDRRVLVAVPIFRGRKSLMQEPPMGLGPMTIRLRSACSTS